MLLDSLSDGEYAVSYLQSAGKHEVWLNRLVARDSAGKPRWERRAVLTFPKLAAEEEIVHVDCAFRGAPDASIIAVGRWTSADTVANIRAAWRPNASRTGFDTLAHRDVSCGFDEDRS